MTEVDWYCILHVPEECIKIHESNLFADFILSTIIIACCIIVGK